MKIYPFAVILAIFLEACQNPNAYVNIYDKSIITNPPKCLALRVFPPDKPVKEKLLQLYHFQKECPYTLEVNTKEGIHCHSTYNVPQKTLSNFPSAYIRMEIKKGMKTLYSYYVDLTHSATPQDAKEGFERIEDDLKLN